MPRYKRSAAEAELDISALEEQIPHDPIQADTLKELRNMWEFASLMQYIFMFGHVVKIDEDLDIEDLEHECLLPSPSEKLAHIGLSLLKYVSSHRGLTPDIFAEYTRRQYLAKAPPRNPFGDDEEPTSFNDLDIYTRIRILHQLSIWTFGNAERIRGLMPEDEDHLNWRIEPLGWDKEDRSYFVLDDNRLYRRTDQPIPPPTPKVKAKSKARSKKAKQTVSSRATRAAKRRRIEDTPEEEHDEEDEKEQVKDTNDEDTIMTNGEEAAPQQAEEEEEEEEPGYGFTSKTWECVAITLSEYQDFLASIVRTRDSNERQLRQSIEDDVLPIIEKRAEALKQKQVKKLRELENLQKMASAKRSSRLADKADRYAKEQEEREAEEKREAELKMAREEQDKQKRIEEGHESRRLTREQRLKDREVKRILHEEELARLEREASTAEETASQHDTSTAESAAANRKRLSSRNLQSQREAHKKELDRITQDQQAEDDKWYFDCSICGMHGENLDDGSHSVACERCNVWQHSGCHGITPKQCERPEFHFVCGSCRRKEKAAKEQKSGVVLKLGKRSTNGSPDVVRKEGVGVAGIKREDALPDYIQRQLDGETSSASSSQPQQFASPYQGHTQVQQHSRPPSSGHYFPTPVQQNRPPQQPWQGSPLQLAPQHINQGYPASPQQPTTASPNGHLSPQQRHANQHQWIHYNAIQHAGGHISHTPTQYQQSGYPPRGQQNHSYPAPAYYQPPFSTQPRSQLVRPQQQGPRPGPGQESYQRPPSQGYGSNGVPNLLQNGTVQPIPTSDHPSSSPPAQRPSYIAPQQHTPQHQYTQLQQGGLTSSPHASFPPPATGYQKQAGISPVKSSPPPRPSTLSASIPASATTGAPLLSSDTNGAALNGHSNSPKPDIATRGPTHGQASPSTSFDGIPKLATPSKTSDVPAPPSANANLVVADGMSGPWPKRSLDIPQKNDVPSQPPLN